MDVPFFGSANNSPSNLDVSTLMSVSPIVARPSEAGRSPYQKLPGTSRLLTVRHGSKDMGKPSDNEMEVDNVAEVSGDMNERTRNKYVKGVCPETC